MSDDTVGARPDCGGAAPEPDEEVKADTADRAPGDYGAPALDLAGCAAVLDLAARESTVMSMTMTVRQRLGLGSRVPADVPDVVRATSWAAEYHLSFPVQGGRRRVALEPRDDFPDGSYPPAPTKVPEAVVRAWTDLSVTVTEPAAVARLEHLLFHAGAGDARRHAQAASDAYLTAAKRWARGHDVVQWASAALRLARAVGDPDRASAAMDALLGIADEELGQEEAAVGSALTAIEHVLNEPECAARVDELLELATSRAALGHIHDRVLAMMLRRAPTDDDKARVWTRRVDAALAAADAADSNLIRSVRLMDAVQLAEDSGDGALRERAVSALQAVRNDALEMMHISAGSRLFVEQFEKLRDALAAGESWQRALIQLAHAPAFSGDAAQNEKDVKEQLTRHPLGALFPDVRYGVDGMPFYTATEPEEIFETRWRQHENDHIRFWVEVVLDALMQLPPRFGVPSRVELVRFLLQWPGIEEEQVAVGIADALVRLWCGDGRGAMYTLLPLLEAHVRSLVLATERGVYRMQKSHAPGQFPGLGALLPILIDEYRVGASHSRYLTNLLVHPVGLNLRNLALHGITMPHGHGEAALLIQASLFLGTLTLAGEPEESDAGAEDVSIEGAVADATSVEEDPEDSGLEEAPSDR